MTSQADLRELALAYRWFLLVTLLLTFVVVLAAIPFVAALVLGAGWHAGPVVVLLAAAITFPFSLPVAFLLAAWVFNIAQEAWGQPVLPTWGQVFPRGILARIRVRRVPVREVPAGALGTGSEVDP